MHTLIEKYGRAELGIGGNCGFALLGPDLQEGEAGFVEIALREIRPHLLGSRMLHLRHIIDRATGSLPPSA